MLIQSSWLKTLLWCIQIKVLLFLVIHLCHQGPDVGVQLFSSHLRFLERGEGSSWLSGMESGIVCPVSRLSAFEAKSLLHIFSSFLSGHVVDVHGIWVFGWIKIKSSRILSSLFVCVTASCVLGVRLSFSCFGPGYCTSHAHEIVLESDSPFVPIIEVCRLFW